MCVIKAPRVVIFNRKILMRKVCDDDDRVISCYGIKTEVNIVINIYGKLKSEDFGFWQIINRNWFLILLFRSFCLEPYLVE